VWAKSKLSPPALNERPKKDFEYDFLYIYRRA
jgi:hypothetical protein